MVKQQQLAEESLLNQLQVDNFGNSFYLGPNSNRVYLMVPEASLDAIKLFTKKS
jgi:hypothetical protein